MSCIIPDEMLEHVFSFIDDRRDLCSLVLASKHFNSMVQPHIQYRTIRCTLGTTKLWDQLSKVPVLAQNVRSIEIQSQLENPWSFTRSTAEGPIVPREFMDHAQDPMNRKFYDEFPEEDLPQLREAEKLLICALKNMPNLKSFTWDRWAPLLDSRLDEDIQDDIWTALATGCPALEHLSVVDASDNEERAPYIRPIHHSAIWKLPHDLKFFKYHTYAYRYLDQCVPVDELTAMLRRCPNLEALTLWFTLYPVQHGSNGNDISTADLNQLFANMSWPKLHTLRLASASVNPSTAARFFDAHPTLSNLDILENTRQAKFIKDESFRTNIYPYPAPSLTLLPGSLPNLQKRSVPKYFAAAIDAAHHQA